MKNKVVRFLIFFLGPSALSLGIALVTRAGQGTSTVSSFAYVMQRLTHFSMGLWVVITNGLFFLAQLYMSADMRETPTQTYVLPILKGVINGMAVTLEISFEVFQKPDRNFL